MDVQCSWPGSPPCAKYSLSRGETLSILPRSRLTCSVPRSWVPNFRSGDRSLTASPRVKKIASSLQSSASVGTIPNPFTIQYRSISAPNRRPWCMSPGFASVSQSSAGLSSCITEKAVKKMTPSSVSEDFLDAFQKAFQEATAQTSKERHDRENAEQRYLCLETEMRECKKQNGALREQVASLLEKCNALVSENLKLSTELNQAKQQYDDERIKAKMFQDQVHDKLQKADALKETLQCAWKQLTSARAALSETELAAAQSKKENEQLRQDISIEKNRCNALQGEMRILAEQRKSETELCLSLKEQLKNFRQLQQAAGDIDSDNARLREELSRFQEDVCNLRMVEQKFASCKAELENLKQVNTQFALQIQSQQKKIESFQEKQREAEATSARLGFELKTEKQKNEELKYREGDLKTQVHQLSQERDRRAAIQVHQDNDIHLLSQRLEVATNELERLRCELTTEKQTVNKLQERERDLLRQCCATTQQAEEERAAQKQKMEEVHNIAKRSEDQNARLQQQIAEEELKRRQQEEEVHCLSHRLAESIEALKAANEEAAASREQARIVTEEMMQLRELRVNAATLEAKIQAQNRLVNKYKKVNEQLELKLTQLGADFHAQSGTLRSAQEEVRLKEQTIRDATASEKTLRTRLLKTEEDLSACQEIMKVLERDKSLLFHYKVEFEKQAERAQEMRSRQRQHEEEISLLNEELQQRQLCHQDEINTLHSQLSDQMAREKGLADEVDRSHRRLEVLRIQLDEAEARIEALKIEQRAREEAEAEVRSQQQKCKFHEEQRQSLATRCQVLEQEIHQLRRATDENSSIARRCEDLEARKAQITESLREARRDCRSLQELVQARDNEICSLKKNESEMRQQFQRQRVENDMAVAAMIDAEVNTRVSALKERFQSKIQRLQKKLADRSSYEKKLREVMRAELCSLERWNQEMEEWEQSAKQSGTRATLASCRPQVACCLHV